MAIFIIYSICLVVGVLAFLAAGMTLFDSICHTMCTLSTGGFSNKLNSVGEYNNLAIEIITIIIKTVIMIIARNFAILSI